MEGSSEVALVLDAHTHTHTLTQTHLRAEKTRRAPNSASSPLPPHYPARRVDKRTRGLLRPLPPLSRRRRRQHRCLVAGAGGEGLGAACCCCFCCWWSCLGGGGGGGEEEERRLGVVEGAHLMKGCVYFVFVNVFFLGGGGS